MVNRQEASPVAPDAASAESTEALAEAKPDSPSGASPAGVDLDPAHLFNQAMDARERGDLARADRLLRAVLLRAPTDTEALLQLVAVLRGDGSDGALAEAERLLLGHLPDAEAPQPALVELGDLRLDRNDPAGAAKALGMALELAPHDAEALYLLGNAFFDVGAHAEAEKAYGLSLETEPFAADTWHNLLLCREARGDLGAAREAARTWLAMTADDPDDPELSQEREQVRVRLGTDG